MNVSRENKFIYLGIPRTGSRWTFRSLSQYGLVGIEPRLDALTHKVGIPEGCEDYLVIATIRHPLTRMASCWRWVSQNWENWGGAGIAAHESFESFVRYVAEGRTAIQSQNTELGEIKPDVLLRFETLPGDLAKLPFVSESPTGFNGGGSDPYTAETKALVAKLWSDDLERFDYQTPS